MAALKILTAERVRDLFDYDAEIGALRWKAASRNVKAGAIAGSIDSITGYRKISVDGRSLRAHRLIWLHFYGVLPDKFVDHINGVRDDNRIVNLRISDNSQNQWNRGIGKNNKSGITGVSYTPPWSAKIKVNGKQINLGCFETKEEAVAAYDAAKQQFHGCPAVTRQGIPDSWSTRKRYAASS